MRKIILILIVIYQKVLSLDHGVPSWFLRRRICRFHPSCSHYMYDSIEKFGVLKGGWKGIKRFFRCHPWNDGGYDPVSGK
jgi:putative membrane protein insertion efficiency factor